MSDLRIEITSLLNQGKSVQELNNSIKALEKHPSLRKIKIKMDIDPKVLGTLERFNTQMKSMNRELMGSFNEMKKVTETVVSPKGLTVTREHYDGLGKTFKETVGEADKLTESMEKTTGRKLKLNKETNNLNKGLQLSKARTIQQVGVNKDLGLSYKKTEQNVNKQGESLVDLNKNLDGHEKLTRRVIETTKKGKNIYTDTTKNLDELTKSTVKYNEAGEQIGNTRVVDDIEKNEKEAERHREKGIKSQQTQANKEKKINQQRINSLKTVATERTKIRRQLQGMQSSGQISSTQFQDLSGRLINVKDTQSLNKYRESMNNLVGETNRASTSQTKLNQAQGNFRVNLKNLQSQGKITEQQLRQFSSAVDTTKSVGQVKRLSTEIDKLKIKAQSGAGTSGLLSSFDADMGMRKFDDKSANLINQFPSIDQKAIGVIRADMQKLHDTTGLTRNKMRGFNQSLTEVATSTKKVTAGTNTMAGAFSNAMIKFPMELFRLE